VAKNSRLKMVDLNEYRESVRQIRQYAVEHNVSEAQTTEIFQACFRQLEAKYSKKSNRLSRPLRCAFLFLFISIISLHLYNQRWLNDAFVRISQNSIYPVLYALRKLAIPIVSLYPSLSGMWSNNIILMGYKNIKIWNFRDYFISDTWCLLF